jgi:hypothetical protein
MAIGRSSNFISITNSWTSKISHPFPVSLDSIWRGPNQRLVVEFQRFAIAAHLSIICRIFITANHRLTLTITDTDAEAQKIRPIARAEISFLKNQAARVEKLASNIKAKESITLSLSFQ